MERSVESKLTIYFEEPFWVGVFEELDGDKLSVCRTVFGAEPTARRFTTLSSSITTT